MKCSTCPYYMNSKVFGRGCNCSSHRPCDIERTRRKQEHHRKQQSKRAKRYDTT